MAAGAWTQAVALAKTQLGVVTWQQLRDACGITRSALRCALERGRLERLFESAYRLPGAPSGWRQYAVAGTLLAGPGSASSHQTAALIFGLDAVPAHLPHLHLSVPNKRRVVLPSRFSVHRPKHPFLTVQHQGLTVTSLPRTIVDLAGVLDEKTLELVLDDAHHQVKNLGRDLEAALNRVSRRLPGLTTLRALLAERQGQSTESPLEVEVWRALRHSALPRPRLQLELRDDDQHLITLDFAWPAHRVALHVDGYRWHSRRTNFDTDARQRSRLAALDWASVTVTSGSLEDRRWLTDLGQLLRARAPQRVLPF